MKQNKEEKLLSLLLDGKTVGDAIEITEKEFPVKRDPGKIRLENGLVMVLD